MSLVKLLTNKFMPNWQKGVTVNIDEPELSELLGLGEAELLEPLPEPKVEVKEEVIEEIKEDIVVQESKPKKARKKS